MTGQVLRRLLGSFATQLVVISGVFFVLIVIGDPCRNYYGARARLEQVQQCRHEQGFDRPVLEQYASYMSGLFVFDFGRAMNKRAVVDIVASRLPRTMLLSGMAILFELLLGLALGIFAATKRNTVFDSAAMAISFIGISAPTFVTGVLFLTYFAFLLGWFPVGGVGVGFYEQIRHAMLPALTLAIFNAAQYARLIRSEMIETLRSDYVRTARAKGLSYPRVVLGHAARNALLPIVTLLGLNLPLLVSGAIITEQIYAWPGMGRLAVESISTFDVRVVMAVVVLACVMVPIGNLLADLGLATLDPRVRDGGGR